MESTDSESAEDEPEHEQPYVDIEAVNNTLTEVHDQYNKLLLKYSDALNVIDNLKCQLACGINYGGTGVLQGRHSVSDLRVHSPEVEYVFTRKHTRRTAGEPISGLLKLREGNFNRETAIVCSYDLASPPELKYDSQIALRNPEESTRAKTDDLEVHHAPEFQDAEPSSSYCTSTVSDLPHESLVSQPTVVADTNKFSAPCANDRARSGPPNRKKSPGQLKHNQVAVVYPALRSAQICTMACCMTHSCCCCKHVESPKKTACTVETSSPSCFTANFSAPAAPSSQKCLCSATSNRPDAALFKISSALDIALQQAEQLRSNSFSLLEKW